ncbi:hypothetical protein SAY87_021168 [Trapa incisa]|uniref:Uncharacterized protein n=1 Tax=Trapa incisa TaxID=236973 RepID=A0AAN7JQS2_9MYRT|nr:hypothetical protein SAY87_021168 [Trapa incisa]
MPNFSKYSTLERLILEDCEKLVKIEGSLGNLKRLKYLNLKGCNSLCCLPEELCSLDALEEITIKWERKGSSSHNHEEEKVFIIPEHVGKLRSLAVLEIVGVHINKIPHSIGELQMLNQLVLFGCSGFESLLESVWRLNSLEKLDLSNTDIEALPISIGGLEKLQILSLNHSEKLTELPHTLGNLESLIDLDLSWTKLTSLTDSIGHLSKLKVLKVTDTHIKKLPETIQGMENLEELHAHGCSMEEVPDGIKGLKKLKILDLSGCIISSLPHLGEVSSLQTLLLEGCDELTEVPEVLSKSLTTLSVDSLALQKLPDFPKLEQLNKLKLSDRSDRHSQSDHEIFNLQGIENLSKLSVLELHLLDVENFPEIVCTFWHLKVLVVACIRADYQILQLPSTLSKLGLQYVDIKNKIRPASLGHLENLVWLEIHDCSTNDRLNSLEIDKFHSLTSLSIVECSNLIALVDLNLPKNLEKLWIRDCGSLKSIPDLSELQNLLLLDLSRNKGLTMIYGLDKLRSLETINIALSVSQ